MAKVVSGEVIKPLDYHELPAGEFHGKWTGYVVQVRIGRHNCRLTTDVGVRGIDIPCTVKVAYGSSWPQITVTAD